MEEIRNIISKFANSIDRKDWEGLKSILSHEAESDYSSLRGVKEVITAEEYVAKRITALHHIDTHHIIANHEITVVDESAECKASTIIWRRTDDVEFNTHALYVFMLRKGFVA